MEDRPRGSCFRPHQGSKGGDEAVMEKKLGSCSTQDLGEGKREGVGVVRTGGGISL
jgi:hypothetical protein